MLVYFVGLGFSSVWAGEIYRYNGPIPDELIREKATGIVVDASGNPVEGVQVWHMMDVWRDDMTTGADGRFQLEVLVRNPPFADPTIYSGRVVARTADGRRGFLQLPKGLTDFSQLKDLRVELTEPKIFEVQVVDHADKVVSDATVALLQSDEILELTHTDQDGRAQLLAPPGVPLSHMAVNAGERGIDYIQFDNETGKPVSEIQRNEDGRIVMRLAKVRPLTVRAVDTHGKPLPDAWITFNAKLPGKGSAFWLRYYDPQMTNQQGEMTIYVPLEIQKDSTLFCNKEGYYRRSPGELTLATREEPITYVFEKRVPMSGKVVFEDGRPAEDVRLKIVGRGYHSTEVQNEFAPGHYGVKTDAQGRFDVLVRPERCFSIQAHKDEVRSSVVHQIVRDTAVEDITLTIKPMMTVSGEVLDYRGKKVNYGTVTLEPIFDNAPQSVPPASVLAAPLSDEQKELPPLQFPKITYTARVKYGKYETSVPAGRYAITRSSCFVEGGYVEVLPDQPATADLVVMVGNTNTLTGRVFPDGFEPIGIKQVTVTAIPDDIFEPRHETISDENGNYSLPLRLVHRWVGAFDRQAKMGNIGRVPAGMPRADIEIGTLGKLSGTLVDADTNKPIAKREICLSVQLERSDGTTFEDFHLWGQTDEQGKFSLPGLVEAYDHRLAIQPAGAKPGDLSTLRRIKLIHKHPGGDVDLGKISDAEAPDALGPRSRFTQPEGAK